MKQTILYGTHHVNLKKRIIVIGKVFGKTEANKNNSIQAYQHVMQLALNLFSMRINSENRRTEFYYVTNYNKRYFFN